VLKGILTRVARAGGGKLLDKAVGQVMAKVPDAAAKGSVTGAVAGAALTRIATKSVPGAIIVGAGLLAKTLYDRRQASKAAPEDSHD
jgi:hypothetical protein